jgi:hypothetical protein
MPKAHAQEISEGLFGKREDPFVAPGRLFAVHMPTDWTVVQGDNPNEVQLVPTGPGHPLLFVRVLRVPSGADPMQVALRAIDDRLSKMPRFRLVSKKRVELGGYPAATVTATFSYQGNMQYPRALEEVFLLAGGEAFMIHFECSEPAAEHYLRAMTRFYQTFVPRPASTQPDKPKSLFPEVENIPF